MRGFAVVLILHLVFSTTAAATGVDLVIVNANVRTMASAETRSEAIAISNGEIVAVGSSRAISSLADADTKVIDAGGKLVLPGFNDAHVHFAAIGNIFSSVKLSDLRTPIEFAQRIEYIATFVPKGRWILGSGWDNQKWIPNDAPTKTLVDAATPDNPVFVYSVDAKAAFVNSKALSIAGIDKTTKDPLGGVIFRDQSGEPTGVLRGTAIELVSRIVPKDHIRDWPTIIEAASNYSASLGITSVQDTHSDDLYEVLRELNAKGRLKTRVYDCTNLQNWPKFAGLKIKAASGDAMVRRGCMKFFAEDEIGEAAQLERDVVGADKAGLQIAIHAIGPKPNQIVLDVFESAIKANGDRDRRFRVEHARNARPQDRPRFVRSNIIASMQPWLFYDESGSGSDDFEGILKLKTRVAFGSDASISDFDPMLGIYAAVTGKNAISVEQAVHAYTVGSAFAEFQEKVKGTIELGKLADLVILSEDIFSIEKAKIRGVRVETTIVNGKLVFESKKEKLR